MKRFFSLVAMLSLLALLVGFVPAPEVRINFLVGFNEAVDANVIRGAGAELKHVYNNFPVALVSASERQIAVIAQNKKVAFFERDLQWHALGQILPWGIDRIDAEVVVADGTTGSGVKVAILDTGIDTSHTDLQVYGGYNFIANNTNYNDDQGHGTHVAGTVAALMNTYGVVGAAPAAHLYAVKVLDASGSGTWSGIAAGIDWSISNGMQIINMSLGGSTSSSTLELACQRAWDAGILLVAAAGNSGNLAGRNDTVGYPAKYPTVIAVAATDSSDTRPSWSSTGPAVEIAAPGVSILSTVMGNTYGNMSGTSMASPHVAGVAALVWHRNPTFTNQQLRDALTKTAIDLGAAGRDTWYGFGLVYAPAAVNYRP
ncbi:MAG: S8 family peptidase [Bacillota bacterium]|nr:S8 family peptidase [Bacillota bacterium]